MCKCPASGLIAQQGPKERLHNNMLFRILNEKKQRGSWPIQIQRLVSRFMLSGYPSKGNFTWNPHGLWSSFLSFRTHDACSWPRWCWSMRESPHFCKKSHTTIRVMVGKQWRKCLQKQQNSHILSQDTLYKFVKYLCRIRRSRVPFHFPHRFCTPRRCLHLIGGKVSRVETPKPDIADGCKELSARAVLIVVPVVVPVVVAAAVVVVFLQPKMSRTPRTLMTRHDVEGFFLCSDEDDFLWHLQSSRQNWIYSTYMYEDYMTIYIYIDFDRCPPCRLSAKCSFRKLVIPCPQECSYRKARVCS